MDIHWCTFFVFLLLCHIATSQVGNTCYMQSTNIPGICKISSDCPEVEEQGRNGVSPTVCGYFQLTTPIVCCEGSSFTDGGFQSPSRPQTSNNIPQSSRPSSLIPDDGYSSGSDGNSNSENSESDITFSNENNEGNGDSIVYPSDGGTSNTNNFNNNNNQNNNNNNNGLRKSEAKCREYTKQLNNVVQAIPLLTETDVVSVNIEKCDNNGVPLIVGGEPASPGEFPFMAALGFEIDGVVDWRCGATLISDYYVVTAAHCTYSRDGGAPKIVRLGATDLKDVRGRTYADYNIESITAHHNYNYPKKYNDIALIKLTKKVRFSKYIRPACLFTNSYLKQSQSIATGYGKPEFAASENLNKLMKVALQIYNNERCAHTFGTDKRTLPRGIISSMLCAGEVKGGKDTCQGDSGGPLLVTKKSNQCKFYLIGVTSFGKSCGEANTPAIYTKVSEYLSWIENIVW